MEKLNKFYLVIKPVMPFLILGALLSLLIFIFIMTLGKNKISFGGASDIENFQGQINVLKADVWQCRSNSSQAINASSDAAKQSASAERAANRAASSADEINRKLDRLFKHRIKD